MPLISAVGHETDYTIADFVADKRAATPSVAGEIVILNKTEAVENLKETSKKIKNLIKSKIAILKKEFNFLTSRRILIKPETILNKFNQAAGELHIKLIENMERLIRTRGKILSDYRQLIYEKNIFKRIYIYKMAIKNIDIRIISDIKNYLTLKKSRLKIILENLQEKNPVAILERGFAIIYREKEDKNIKSIDEVKINQKVRIMLRDGILNARILKKIYKKLEIGFKNEN